MYPYRQCLHISFQPHAQSSCLLLNAVLLQLVSPYWDATFRAKHTAYCQKHGRDWDGMWVLGPSFAKGVYELCMPGDDLGTIGQGAYGKVS